MFHSQKGITVLTMLMIIAVIVILSTITIAGISNALKAMSESKYKSDLRGVEDRLKLYHEDANLASIEYRKENLSWDGEAERATHTGKVEDGINEDTAIFILREIPDYFQNKIMIEKGELVVKEDTISEEEKGWTEDMQILVK